MRLVVKRDTDAVAAWTATYVKMRINAFAPTPARPFVLGLPTGSSPLKVYVKLVEMFKAGEVSFENVITFNMDEYVGLPEKHPQSYHSYMWDNFFKHVDIQCVGAARAHMHYFTLSIARRCAAHTPRCIAHARVIAMRRGALRARRAAPLLHVAQRRVALAARRVASRAPPHIAPSPS